MLQKVNHHGKAESYVPEEGTRLEAKIKKMQEMFTKDLEELKNKQTRDE